MTLGPPYLQIPLSFQQQIDAVLTTLPVIHGKISIALTFNCGSGGTVGSLEINKSIAMQYRP